MTDLVDQLEACNRCEHPWDDHVLEGMVREGSPHPPVEGWVFCPVRDCDCTGTWALSADLMAEILAGAE